MHLSNNWQLNNLLMCPKILDHYKLVFDGVTFPYNDAESDDGRFEPDGNKTLAFEFNYLVFTSNKTPNLSIQVMRWDEEKFDTFLVRKISASDATLK